MKTIIFLATLQVFALATKAPASDSCRSLAILEAEQEDVEKIFVTFDRNLDGFVDPSEVYSRRCADADVLQEASACRVPNTFQELLKRIGELIHSDNAVVQESILHFMLKFGRPPKSPSENPIEIAYAIAQTKLTRWTYRADRNTFFKLLTAIGRSECWIRSLQDRAQWVQSVGSQ